MLGPGARTQRLLSELHDEGTRIGRAELERVRGPAGLDLGAEGPQEIAAAIVAEIVALRHGRGSGFLRDRPGPIHERHAPAVLEP
jgi:xanthine/CO dehydrogenase XdhC/CoxF family maturation factor